MHYVKLTDELPQIKATKSMVMTERIAETTCNIVYACVPKYNKNLTARQVLAAICGVCLKMRTKFINPRWQYEFLLPLFFFSRFFFFSVVYIVIAFFTSLFGLENVCNEVASAAVKYLSELMKNFHLILRK